MARLWTSRPYQRGKNRLFLRDVFFLTLMAFGGPQAHFAIFTDFLVIRRRYLTEADLIELYALCQILPGPTSTQTITAVGFRIGGPRLAFLTLLVWVLPAATLMTLAALFVEHLADEAGSLRFTQYIQPMAVSFVVFAGYRISARVITNAEEFGLMLIAAVVSYYARSPWAFPFILLVSGVWTAFRFRSQHAPEAHRPLRIEWANFFLFVGVLVGAAVLGKVTTLLPIRLFENFYRNGSLIFGGGQVLIPLIYTEFVEFKRYLSSEEFLTGFALVQAVPGPVFSFCAYIGTLSMRSWGLGGQLLGSVVATTGIFLPGTFLIFFVIRFWNQLKRYRVVRASLAGINAASSGLMIAAALLLFEPLALNVVNIGVILLTLGLLRSGKVPSPVIILLGLVAGFLF